MLQLIFRDVMAIDAIALSVTKASTGMLIVYDNRSRADLEGGTPDEKLFGSSDILSDDHHTFEQEIKTFKFNHSRNCFDIIILSEACE